MKILVTCFEPFGGDPENASLEATRRLEASWASPRVQVVAGVLPVSFEHAGAALASLLETHRPDAVLAVGEAGGRIAVTPERWAVNEDDARIPDNAGAQPRATPIVAGGDHRRPAAFDVDALVAAIRARGVPAEASEDAGRFLCNHVAYLVAGLSEPGCFVHVPAVRSSGAATVGGETDPGAAASPSALGFDDLAVALAAVVETIAHAMQGRGSDAAQEAGPGVAREDRAETRIAASPERVYRALLEPEALAVWLPPEGATGTIEDMDARVGGGFRAELRFVHPLDPKTTADSDVTHVAFVELEPDRRVVQRVTFETPDPRFAGAMRMAWELESAAGGTRVRVSATEVPSGISQEDHELGLSSSLANLRRFLES